MKVRNAFCTQPLSWLVCKLISSCSGWEFSQMLMSEQHLFLTIFLVTLEVCYYAELTYCISCFGQALQYFMGYGWNSRHRSDRIMSFQEESKFCLPPFVLDPHYWVWMWNQVQEKVKSRVLCIKFQMARLANLLSKSCVSSGGRGNVEFFENVSSNSARISLLLTINLMANLDLVHVAGNVQCRREKIKDSLGSFLNPWFKVFFINFVQVAVFVYR